MSSSAFAAIPEFEGSPKQLLTAIGVSPGVLVDATGQRVSGHDRLPLAADIPTLIVWGADDAIIPSRHAADAQATLPSCRVEIEHLSYDALKVTAYGPDLSGQPPQSQPPDAPLDLMILLRSHNYRRRQHAGILRRGWISTAC